MWGIGSVVSNVAGAANVRNTGTKGSIKTAFGNLFLNLTAAAGSLGVGALAKRLGQPQFQSPAAQRNVAEELTGRLRSPVDGQGQRKAVDAMRFLPAVIVAGLGTVAVAGVLIVRAFRKG